MASIRKNFSYNLILTLCNYLFPLITYPYVSRVLGVERIGICNFVDGIVNYFILFCSLGIASYGIRELAKCRKDYDRRNDVFSNLIAFNSLSTIVALLALVSATLWLPSLQPYREFLWLGVLKLVCNMFLIEWFFQGIQEFKYITIRSVLVKLIFIACLFVFVHTKEDVIIYYGLTVGSKIVNAVINWTYSTKYRRLSFRHLNLKLFVAPILAFGYYRILTSMYTSFNIVFLGFSSGDAQVGCFSTATKLYAILMSVFTAFTTVMVPKVSELLASGEKERLQIIANKTFSLLSILSLPIIIVSLFCAEDIILILSGPGYEGAYTPFRIVIFLLLVVGIEQILIQQFLMASSSNSAIIKVSTVGAVVGVTLNFLITPTFGAIGSAISWGLSELAVLFTGILLVKKTLGIYLRYKTLFVNVLWSLLYIAPLTFVYYLHLDIWLNLILSGAVVFFVFLLINLKLNKNDIVEEMAANAIPKLNYMLKLK